MKRRAFCHINRWLSFELWISFLVLTSIDFCLLFRSFRLSRSDCVICEKFRKSLTFDFWMRDFQFACWTEIKMEFIFMFHKLHSLVNSIINSVYFLSRPPFKHSQSIQQFFLTRLPAARSFCHILHIQHSPGQPAYVYVVHHIHCLLSRKLVNIQSRLVEGLL